MHLIHNLDRDSYDETFARAGIRGTYLERPPCPRCKGGRSELVSPLVIEWEVTKWDPGSDVIADFTWPCGLQDIVITQRVRECLEGRFTGCWFETVEMIQDPKLKKPTSPKSRAKPRVWLPYEGPPLWGLQVTSECRLDLERSGRILLAECATCGRQTIDVKRDYPLVVDPSTWDGSDVFTIREIGKVVFLTTPVKETILANGFTNVVIKERGEIPSIKDVDAL